MLVCGTSEGDWPHVAALAEKHACIIPAFGLHPWYTTCRTPQFMQRLESYLAEFGRAAVGETGLDHAPEFRDNTEQEPVLRQQLELAADLNRPVTLHCRRAWNRMPPLLHSLRKYPPAIILHAFSGSVETVTELKGLPVYFSFSGSITYRVNRRAEKTVPLVPPEQLLIETDAPDMLPEQCRGTESSQPPNLPEYLPYVFDRLAELRPESPEELHKLLEDNSRRIISNCGSHDGSF